MHARRTIGSMTWAEPLLHRIPPWKSVLGQPLEERVRRLVAVRRVIGLGFGAVGALFVLTAFGIAGPVYTN